MEDRWEQKCQWLKVNKPSVVHNERQCVMKLCISFIDLQNTSMQQSLSNCNSNLCLWFSFYCCDLSFVGLLTFKVAGIFFFKKSKGFESSFKKASNELTRISIPLCLMAFNINPKEKSWQSFRRQALHVTLTRGCWAEQRIMGRPHDQQLRLIQMDSP